MLNRIPKFAPLTPLQHGMLMHYLLHTGDGVDIQQMEVRLPRELDLDAFERAWRLVFERHDALRTQIIGGGLDEPVQMSVKEIELPFEVTHLSHYADMSGELEFYLNQDRSRGFKLDKAPLMRLQVYCKTSSDPLLIWTTHHIILDGRSRLIVLREVFDTYDELQDGREPDHPCAPSYYAYARWLSNQNWTSAEMYWKGLFDGFSERTPLPGELSRITSGSKGLGCAEHHAQLTRDELNLVSNFAVARQITVNTLVQAAWSLVLSRHCGKKDVVFGVVRACRHDGPSGTESTVGLIINTVPVRVNTEPGQVVGGWLRDLRAHWIGMRPHERTPLSQIQRWVDVRSGSHLFDSLLVFEAYELEQEMCKNSSRCMGRDYRVHTQTSLPIALTVTQSDVLQLKLQVDCSLLNEKEAGRLLTHYKNILLSLVSSAEATLAEVSMLSEQERRELLLKWNDTRVTYPRDKTLWEIFSDVADVRTASIAVSSGSTKCTYGSLKRRAMALAAELQRRGVKPGNVVGILGEQRISTIVGILGVVAAGAAYATLDPVYPRRRLGFMLRQSGASLLIGRPSLVEKIELDISSLDPEWEVVTSADGLEQPALHGTEMVDGSSAAYVLFTSGSTGDPKGSLITNRAVSRIIFDTDFVKLSFDSVFAQVSSLSFDISTLEIWGALLHGGELALIDRMLVLSASQFKTELERTGTTDIHLTTTVFNTLAREMPDIFSGLKTVYVGGEQMNPRWTRDVLIKGPPARLVNSYGPTETCWASFYTVEDIPEHDCRIPIGRPVSNTSLYVVDDDLNLVSPGVEGELYIGGDGLAMCYINNPVQTRDCFVDDFLGVEPSGRLYRTGDRVFRQEDGTIVYLGRRDKQVKIRGHRVELGEVEAALTELDDIEEAVVKIWPNGNDHRLAGYVLVRKDSHASMRSILASLSNRLPEPMIPSKLEVMDAFPVTPNGKLDRTALPEPEWYSSGPATATVPYLSETQQVIADVWREVLEHDHIGVNDSFFTVGGDSLMAAQLVARISRAVDQRVSIHTFFDHPTIAALATHVDAARNIGPSGTCSTSRVHAAPHFAEDEIPGYPSRSEARPDNDLDASVEHGAAIVVDRPILDLIESGELELIDAVTVTYIPDWLLNKSGFSDEEVVRSWFDDANRFNAVLSTHLGRVAIATIPLFTHELYAYRDELIRHTVNVLSAAKRIGARTASLAGLIPSATGYGTMISDALRYDGDYPEVTTGHETTASSVTLAVERILRDSHRQMEDECVAFLGLGSIGASSLYLLLRVFPHPRRLILCDAYGKYEYLEAERDRLVQALSYSGEIDIVAAQGKLPARFYDATLVIGATNAPNVVDVDRLRPGVLIVDDSSPHCFSSEQVLNRINVRGDIMVTEGGVLEVPHAMAHVRYVPPASASIIKTDDFTQMSTRHPRRITSCVLSSLLCSAFKESPRTLGAVRAENSLDQYERLKSLGYRAAPARCEAVELPRTYVSSFAERFGSHHSKA